MKTYTSMGHSRTSVCGQELWKEGGILHNCFQEKIDPPPICQTLKRNRGQNMAEKLIIDISVALEFLVQCLQDATDCTELLALKFSKHLIVMSNYCPK